MKVKKAIEWMEFMKKKINCDMPPEEGYLNDYGDKIDEIINLLRQDKKYFPEKINRIIEVEVEASNQEVIDELAKDITDMANGQSHRKGKIGVISTRWVRD